MLQTTDKNSYERDDATGQYTEILSVQTRSLHIDNLRQRGKAQTKYAYAAWEAVFDDVGHKDRRARSRVEKGNEKKEMEARFMSGLQPH
jgi:hypothetical protein